MPTGTATIDFGAAPGQNTASVAVTGQAAILSGSKAEAFLMAAASADHTAAEHALGLFSLVCGDISPGTGFTIYATSFVTRLTGQWGVQWVWV